MVLVFRTFDLPDFRSCILYYLISRSKQITNMYQENEDSVLNDLEQEIYMDPVSRGVRFVNYVIDRIMIYGIVTSIFIISFAIDYSQGRAFKDNFLLQETLESKLWQIVISIIAVIGYYTAFETTTRGRTVGKIITGSIAVTDDGNPLTFKKALLRSLCRLIPFNELSALGNRPWHDSITKTVVIKKTW